MIVLVFSFHKFIILVRFRTMNRGIFLYRFFLLNQKYDKVKETIIMTNAEKVNEFLDRAGVWFF
mgnify:CR=1 FL=1